MDSLRAVPAQIQQQVDAQMAQDTRMTAAEKQEFSQVMLTSIHTDRLIRNVQTDVIAGCNAAEMKSVVDQLNTPLLQKMRGLEAMSTTAAGSVKLRQNLASREVQSPTPNRSRLVRELVTTAGVADTTVETLVETSRSMMEGMGAPPPTREQLSEMRSEVQPVMTRQLNQMMLAVYRDATDEELEKYIAALKTPAFMHFNQSFSKAMIKGIAIESRFAGESLKKLLDKKVQQSKSGPALSN